MRRHFAASLLILASSGLPAAAEALIDKAKAVSKDGPLYTFDIDFGNARNQFRMTVDQSQPLGKRVVRFSPDIATLKGDARKRADNLMARTEGDIWCSDFAENIPAAAKLSSQTQGTATYSFTPVPGRNDADLGKAFKFLKAKATIDKSTGMILAYEMAAPAAFKPAAVAKVNKLSFKVSCKVSPDGRTYIDALDFDLKGSAMMQPLDQVETRRITNLKPLSPSGSGTP